MRIFRHRDRCSHPEKGGDVITDGTEEIEIFCSQEHEEHQEHRAEHDDLFCRITAFFNAFRSSFASSFLRAAKPSARCPIRRPAPYIDSAVQQLEATSGHRTTGCKIPAMQPRRTPHWTRLGTMEIDAIPVTSRKQ